MAGTLNPLSISKSFTRKTLSVLTKRNKRTGSSSSSSVPQAVISAGLFAPMALMDRILERDNEEDEKETVYDSDSSTDEDENDQASKIDSVDYSIPFYFPPSAETCSTIIPTFDCDTFEEEWAEFEAEMIRFSTKHVFDKSESSWLFPYPIKLLAYCGRDFIAMFVLIPPLMFVFLAGLAYLALPSSDLEEEV
ncbi:hypothetical protein C8J56DRAFT_1075411 [Mycena floridula]|nr:hypothetical protein C8J56DRAFT_1075411 [Mycena floridula]